MNSKLIILFLGFIMLSFYGNAQNNTSEFNLKSRLQYDFIFANGWMQKTKFKAETGPDVFIPNRNHNRKIQFKLSLNIVEDLKFSTGFFYGGYSFHNRSKYKKSDFPFLSKDIDDDFMLSMFQDYYDHKYIGVPVHFSYNFLNINNKHQLWFEAGADFYFENSHPMSSSSGISMDTSVLDIWNMEYISNPDRKFKTNYHFGLQYRYQLPNFHEVIFGISTSFAKTNGFSGEYRLFPDYPQYSYTGKFINNFNSVNLNIGYSINPQRLYNKKQQYKSKEKSERLLIPDSMKNKHELRFGINLFSKSKIQIKQENGDFKPFRDGSDWDRILYFEVEYLRFFKENLAWKTGIRPVFSVFSFQVPMKDYPDMRFENKIANLYIYNFNFKIPFGLHWESRINKRLLFEIGTDAIASFNTNENGSTSAYYKNDRGENFEFYRQSPINNKFITPEFEFNFALVYKNKRQNKMIVGFRLNYCPISSFDLEYSIAQKDLKFESGIIPFKPFTWNIYLKHSLTGKKRRFLNSN